MHDMDQKENIRNFEIELMLLINEKLYRDGEITSEMHVKAKDIILKS